MTKEEYWNEKKNLLLKEARSYRAFELGVRYSEPYIAELESKIKHLTEHLEPQTMTALFEQVEEEVRQEQSIKKLEKENTELKKLFADCDTCKRTCDIGNCCKFGNAYLPDVEKILNEQKKFTKAKEIIKKYLAIGVGGKITQNYLDVTKEAE